MVAKIRSEMPEIDPFEAMKVLEQLAQADVGFNLSRLGPAILWISRRLSRGSHRSMFGPPTSVFLCLSPWLDNIMNVVPRITGPHVAGKNHTDKTFFN